MFEAEKNENSSNKEDIEREKNHDNRQDVTEKNDKNETAL